MNFPKLTQAQRQWIETTLAAMTLEEKIGQLLCPDEKRYTLADWETLVHDIPVGSVYLGQHSAAEMQAITAVIQGAARVPVLIAADLEHGAGSAVTDQTDFPHPMALGAACAGGDTTLAREMGRATASEGRACGVHWTFSPVVDLNINFQNPVTNIRALGDNPVWVSRVAAALIKGLQLQGHMAATAKHFPGDGVDDRDQHLCTSINALSRPKWLASYGRVWKTVIRAGVMTVMPGHIALPAYQGERDYPARALPATLDPRLQVDLLRTTLGFQGLIVSDAAPMLGLATRVGWNEKVLRAILAGSDVFLFCEPRRDFAILREAVETGQLSLARLETSVRRVLTLKARLNLHHSLRAPQLEPAEASRVRAIAQAIAEKSLTLLRPNVNTPLRLAAGAKVLTVTLRYDSRNSRPLETVDQELRQRGFVVDHLENPGPEELAQHAGAAEAVFVNVAIQPHDLMGTLRLTGGLAFALWDAFWVNHPKVVFTAFGSPYLLYELPHLPNLYLAYSNSRPSQAAAVRVWLGEIPAAGRCPVIMPEKTRL